MRRRTWLFGGVVLLGSMFGACARESRTTALLVAPPSLEDCLGRGFTVQPQVTTDPHGQGEVLGVGVRVQGGLARIDRFQVNPTINGQPVTGLAVRAHTLQGTLNNAAVADRGWIGATFTGQLHCVGASAGQTRPVVVRIVDVPRLPVEKIDQPSAGGDRPVYQLEIELDAANPRVAGCTRGDKSAIPLPGFWDTAGVYKASTMELSFACLQAGAPLCLRWGTSDVDLASGKYEACARMVRADYCGDGTTHTKEGTQVTPLLRGGGGSSDPNDPHRFEGVWDRDGLICRDHVRWADDDPRCPKHAFSECHSWIGDLAHVFVNGSCVNKSPVAGPCYTP